jgi:hypothetical protein
MVRARFFYNKLNFRKKRKSSFTFAEGENFTRALHELHCPHGQLHFCRMAKTSPLFPPPGKAYFGVAFIYQQTMFLTAVAPFRHSVATD